MYDFVTRRLSFLKTPELVTVVRELAGQPTAVAALAAAGGTAAQPRRQAQHRLDAGGRARQESTHTVEAVRPRADQQGVADDGVEVDQRAGPQEFVEDLLVGGATRVPKQGGADRAGVVVEVGAGVFTQMRGGPFEDAGDGCAGVRGGGTERAVDGEQHAVRIAEFDAAGQTVGVEVDGQRQVAGCGGRQGGERVGIEQGIGGPARGFGPGLHLGLPAQRRHRARRQAGHLGGGRQPIHGVHAGGPQPGTGGPGHARHQQQIPCRGQRRTAGRALPAGEVARIAPLHRQQLGELVLQDRRDPAPPFPVHGGGRRVGVGGRVAAAVDHEGDRRRVGAGLPRGGRVGQKAGFDQDRGAAGQFEQGGQPRPRRRRDRVQHRRMSFADQVIAPRREPTVEDRRATDHRRARAHRPHRRRVRRAQQIRRRRVLRMPGYAVGPGNVDDRGAVPGPHPLVQPIVRRDGGGAVGHRTVDGAEFGVQGTQQREFAPRRAHQVGGGAHDTITEHEQTRPSRWLPGHQRPTRRGAPLGRMVHRPTGSAAGGGSAA
nr:mycofactocin biosynthesis chaperone MftB [Nocardia farcinica]